MKVFNSMISISEERSGLLFFCAVVSASLALAIVFIFTTISRLLAIFADGSGYYLQVARNVASGHGFTFDGLHPTNGFHPLWMIILVVISKMGLWTSESFFRIIGVVEVGLIAAAALVFYRALRIAISPMAALAGGLVFLATALHNLNLMESSVVLVATSSLFLYGAKYRLRGNYRRLPSITFGALLGLAILARLDVALLAVAIGVADAIQIGRSCENRRRRIARLSWTVLGAATLVVPYLVYNQYSFGSIIPVSGRLESTFPIVEIDGLWEKIRSLDKYTVLALLGAVVYLAWWLIARRRRVEPTLTTRWYLLDATMVLSVTTLAHAANELLFMRWALYWHFTLVVPLSGMMVGVCWQVWEEKAHNRTSATIGIVLLCVFLAMHARSISRRLQVDLHNNWHVQAYDVSLWIREHTKPNAILAMPAPEVTGFFSERRTIDLAGLCNSMELQDVIREQRLQAYLKRNGVEYFVFPFPPSQIEVLEGRGDVRSGKYETAAFRVGSDYYRNASDVILLRRSDEVYRSQSFSDGSGLPAGIVWKMKWAVGSAQ